MNIREHLCRRLQYDSWNVHFIFSSYSAQASKISLSIQKVRWHCTYITYRMYPSVINSILTLTKIIEKWQRCSEQSRRLLKSFIISFIIHYFIWQLSVVIFCRFAWHSNVTQSTDHPLALRETTPDIYQVKEMCLQLKYDYIYILFPLVWINS